jgi:hypothetical protein
MKRRASIVVAVAAAVALAAWLIVRQPQDAAQAPTLAPSSGASVVIDLAHHNFGVAADFAPLSTWLASEGFRVRAQRGAFDRESLSSVQVLIIKNALAERNAISARPTEPEIARSWSLPTPSAFTPAEIAAVNEWVLGGGGLLLIFDHMPMPGAARDLAAAFGIEVSNGHAVDARGLAPFTGQSVERAGRAVFSRSEGTLADEPLTNGLEPSERVASVASDGGSAFRLPASARSLLTLGANFVSLLPEVAWRFSEETPREDVAGWSQGGVLRAGQGRLAVFGDGSILMSPAMAASLGRWGGYTADKAPADFGESPRLLLNVLRWLSGSFDDGARSG